MTVRWPPPYTVERCPICWWPFHLPREQQDRYLCRSCESRHDGQHNAHVVAWRVATRLKLVETWSNR